MSFDPNSVAFIFPGQGSQSVGMGLELAAAYPAAKETFDEADSLLGFSLSKLMAEGPADELNDTVNTQPALYVHSLAAWRVLSLRFPDLQPAALAGHSLGELSALAASRALTFADGLRLVRTRGQLMKRAGELAPGGMAAILNLGIPELEQVCAEASRAGETVQVANDNCPGQVVISGAKPAVERAMELAKAAGAKRALPLAVSIAAHSSLMNSIQAEWNAAVDAVPMRDASAPVYGNAAARALTSADDLRADIRAQMQSRVRWTESVQAMIASGIRHFVEVGSGSVLGGLVKRIDPSVTSQALGNPSDFEAL
ncbi:MAG: malonyl CoA-acyl carrier protein transacylase [Anaerolineaceae bacterium]|nr:[acyl-carrier-protein] S-malonyltransferase [Chloroflexota bacterium]WKZ55870.1 MAG: ACP S-malonyltransferase [Anaerolineales bacterium]GJQ39870.1 MAG: malonyl CoA-acyl carrier protein transacylase [Anaerolineaceae bacterium]NOG75613.1 ACP S-malonyltransferase [Chloroflexota bacterium]GIK10355.1 MAG: malonyl CoA-acyl carrier protein transacylase [Chloroflexota bacterium]